MKRPNLVVAIICVTAILILLFVLLYQRQQRKAALPTAGRAPDARVGDPALYPPPQYAGAIDEAITQDNIHDTICVPGYTSRVRPKSTTTNRIKRNRMVALDLSGIVSDYELDHVVPLELGGCPACDSNLWMEPYSHPGAHEKDLVENYLHREVCSNRLPLAEAQLMIQRDWYAVYQTLPNKQEH